MSSNDGNQQQNPNGPASYFNNNGVQDFIPPEETGWRQPDLVTPGNNQQLGYHHNPGDLAGAAANQPAFYNPADLKNVHTGQEQYQGHPHPDSEQWNFAGNADPNTQWHHQDAHQPNVAGSVPPYEQHYGPPDHMFYNNPVDAHNRFDNRQQVMGENIVAFGNGPSDFMNNYQHEHADRHIPVSSGGDLPQQVLYANEPNIVEPQIDAPLEQPLPLDEDHRACGKSVPDIVSYSKDGNVPSGQEYTDVIPVQQQQHNWLEMHGTTASSNQPVAEANNLQPNYHNLDVAPVPLPLDGVEFGRSEPDLAPDIHGDPVRFEPDRIGPDLGMSSTSPPIHHSDPGLPADAGISVGSHVNTGADDLDKRSDHSGSRSSSMMGLSVSESSHSGQHSRSSSFVGETASEAHQQNPPEPVSSGNPVEGALNIPKEPTHHQSPQLQSELPSTNLQNTGIVPQGSSPGTIVFADVGASISEKETIDAKESHNSPEFSSLPAHSHSTEGHSTPQDTVHFQPSVVPPIVPNSQVLKDDEGRTQSPVDLSRMRHKSTEEVDHLVQGGAHPSAFTSVKAGRGGNVVQQKRIMPSPPLWSAEVPALPSNILLTAAAPSPVPKPVLPPSGIPTSIPGPAPLPVIFSSAGPTNVVQPTAVIASTNSANHMVSTSNSSMAPPVSSGQMPPPQSVPQSAAQPLVGSPMLNVAPPKPLPVSALVAQPPTSLGSIPGHPITQPPVPLSLPSAMNSQHQAGIPTQVTQGVANMSLSSERPQMSAAQPAQTQQQHPGVQNKDTLPHQGVPPYGQYPGGYPQQAGAMQGRQRGYPQYPPHQGSPAQGHYPDRSTSRGPYAGYGGAPYDPYGQAYDPYYGYRYGQSGYNRNYYEDYYRQQEYARRRYYSRRYTDPYQTQYDYNRPRSRQDTESPSSRHSDERPSSRQDKSREETDNYTKDRRGYDEYGRQTSYDKDRHRNSYGYARGYQYDAYQDHEYRRMQQQYYDEYYRSQQNRSRGAEEQSQATEDTSSLRRMQQIYYDEYYRSQQNISRGSIDIQYDDTSFASNFHHTGGNTPEGYNQDMSGISKGSSYYESGQDTSQQGVTDATSYSYTDGSWGQPTQVQEAPPQRRTPTKFSLPHIIGRFSPGGHLIKVLPNSPSEGATATVEIHSIEAMLENTSDSQELRSFPGPLIRNETHKGDVISFACSKVKSYREDTQAIDKESAALLWDLMVLLCRQNGTVVGTDMSELILNNHPVLGSGEAEETGGSGVSSSTPTNLMQPKKSVDVEKETRRFRELLLFGRKKDALESAIRSGLWGHALLLATKMDHRTHSSVMTRFANSLPMNDPLQTLYQLMSNRQPAAVTSCSDVNWGDWRPHLAMILSNLDSNAELDKKSIITLGDSLSSRGLVHASHFCYLMVQLGLGTYNKKSSKMVLIGSSHGLAFNQFSTNEAIQQTEVYEYAQNLANKHYTMPNYNAYKFIYACRLAEHGFTTQALHYCEVIAKSILFLPTYHSETLVSQVCQMSNRLKHHDVQYFDGRELTQPQWLSDLESIQLQIMDGRIQPASNPETPMPWVESFSNLSNLAETEDTASTPSTQYNALPSEDDAPHIPDMDNKGFYQPADFQGNQHNQYNQAEGAQYYQQTNQQYTDYENTYHNQQTSSLASMNVDPGASIGSTMSEYSTTATETETGTETEWTNSNASTFDYYGATTYNAASKSSETPNSMPSTPKNTMTPPESPRSRTLSQSSGNQAITPTPAAMQKKQEHQKKAENKSNVKQKGGGGSWFRGLFSRFGGNNEVHLPDDSDKTIEWDEKKGKWVNKDADGDEDEGEVAPPPSDSQLSNTAPSSTLPPTTAAGVNRFSKKHVGRNYVDVFKQQGATTNKSSMAPPALFPTIPNNTAPPVNFFTPTPVAPGVNQPQVGNPGSEPSTPASEHSDQSSHHPQFFNPNSYNGGSSNMGQYQAYNNTQVQSLEPPQPTDENVQTDQWDVPAPVEAAEPAMPMMFNPHQFQQPSFQPPMGTPGSTSSGPTSRGYRQRRAYPAQK